MQDKITTLKAVKKSFIIVENFKSGGKTQVATARINVQRNRLIRGMIDTFRFKICLLF
jgi:hypothetical protein